MSYHSPFLYVSRIDRFLLNPPPSGRQKIKSRPNPTQPNCDITSYRAGARAPVEAIIGRQGDPLILYVLFNNLLFFFDDSSDRPIFSLPAGALRLTHPVSEWCHQFLPLPSLPTFFARLARNEECHHQARQHRLLILPHHAYHKNITRKERERGLSTLSLCPLMHGRGGGKRGEKKNHEIGERVLHNLISTF